MSEIDIWIEVFKILNFRAGDEMSRQGSDSNLIIFYKDVLNVDQYYTVESKVYFNYKTGEVSNVFISYIDGKDSGILETREKFEDRNRQLFRDLKLKSILSNEC